MPEAPGTHCCWTFQARRRIVRPRVASRASWERKLRWPPTRPELFMLCGTLAPRTRVPNAFISRLQPPAERVGPPRRMFPWPTIRRNTVFPRLPQAGRAMCASHGWTRAAMPDRISLYGMFSSAVRVMVAPHGRPRVNSRARRAAMTTSYRTVSAFPSATTSRSPSITSEPPTQCGERDATTSLRARSGTLTGVNSSSPQLSFFFIPVTFMHPLAICIRSGLQLPHPRLLAEVFDEVHGCERVGGVGECAGDDGSWFRVVLASVVCASVDDLDGLRSEI